MLKYFDMLKEAGSVKAAQIDTSTIATAPWTIYKCRYGCDFYGKSYSPWLGGLYVDIPYRNEGIGQRMIDFIKQIAKDLGYYEIYLNTEHAGGYYKRLGWIYIETCLNEGGRMCEIYKYEL